MIMKGLRIISYFLCICLVLGISLQAYALTLMERVKEDIKNNRDIVITSYVGLWYEHNDDPNKNLYWGALFGHDALFDRPKELRVKLPFLSIFDYDALRESIFGDDPIRVKVITTPYRVSQSSKSKSISGKVVVVYLAYRDMERAVCDMGLHLKTGEIPASIRNDPELSILLGVSYIVGYWGHNIYYGGFDIDDLEYVEKTTPDEPRGVFMIGCQTAVWFPEKFLTNGIESLSFTTTNMAPEAYIAVALYDGIGRGLSKVEINRNMARAYGVYQRLSKAPYSLFKNDISNNKAQLKLINK